jgi:hypothetical protein
MENKGHHWLTESYQRNFSNEKGLIWVLTPENKIFETNPENTFKENYFYLVKFPGENASLAVERTLGQIEGDFIAAVRSLERERSLPNQEGRLAIAQFAASMIFRTKPQREHMRSFLDSLVSKGEVIKETLKDAKMPRPLASSNNSVSLSELQEGVKNFDSHHSVSVVSTIQTQSPKIFAMKWILLEAPADRFFVTSDNPLNIVSPEREKQFGQNAFGARADLNHIDSEVSLPLSKTLALIAGWKFVKEAYIAANENQVDQINYRTTRSAGSWIAHERKIFDDFLSKDKASKQTKS